MTFFVIILLQTPQASHMIENNMVYSIGMIERYTGIGRDTLRV